MNNFKDDVFIREDDEFKQIQSCIGMYISSGETAGAIHLFKELFANALDEVNNENSPASNISVIFDEVRQKMTVIDDGRGIPFEHMKDACTHKHAGTKLGELHYHNKKSAGCNGVGITVTIAFSEFFSITCKREMKEKTITFNNCEMHEGKIKNIKHDYHGTEVTFIPSSKYLGEFHITADDLSDWFRHMSYILDDGVTINFTVLEDGEYKYERVYTASSLSENVKYHSTSLEFEPIEIGFESDTLDVAFAFSYDKSLTDSITESYCNYVITIDGGYHEQACKRALIDFLVTAAKKDDPESKYAVIQEDVKKGLIMAIKANHYNPILGGQTKTKVENKEVLIEARPQLIDKLKEYFKTNNGQLAKIISYLRQMAKIRLEAYKIKGIKPPKVMNVFDEADIRDYYGVSDRSSKGYKELIITEGDSASGAIRNARNPKFQAVYTTQGVMKNCAELSFADIAKSRVPHDLARILGVEIGPNSSLANLRFNKIICMQDADADGYNIKSLVCTYLIVCMPQLVEEGRLYSAAPPLYTLSDTSLKKYKLKKNFLFDKHEYNDTINSIIAKNIEVVFLNSDFEEYPIGRMKEGEIKAWLSLNRKYPALLSELSKKTAIHPDIIENVCDVLLVTNNMEEFKKIIERRFEELTYDMASETLIGSYKGEDYFLPIDGLFRKISIEFMDLLSQNPALYLRYKNKNDSSDVYDKRTIGQALGEIYDKYDLNVTQRFKGLGEVNTKLLFYTTLNPKIRKLYRLTMEDREKAMQDVLLLHGKKEVDGRRQILLGKDVDIDDIDN